MNSTGQLIFQAFSQKSYNRVIQLFDQSQKLQTCDPNVGLCFANSLRHIGDSKRSSRAFSLLLKRFPSMLPLLNSFGNYQIATHNIEEAIRLFKKALSIDPGFTDAHINLARAKLKAGQPAAAVSSFRSALRLRPNDMNILLGLADACTQAEEFTQAEEYYLKMLPGAKNAQQPKPYLGYANLLFVVHRIGDAIEVLREATDFAPADRHLNLSLAQYLMMDYQFEHADEFFQRCLELAPSDPDVQVSYAHFAWTTGKNAPFSVLMEALQSESVTPQLICAGIDLLINAEQFDLVQRAVPHCLDICKDHAYFQMFRARYYRLTNDLSSAEECIAKAKKLAPAPTPSNVENERGYIALASGDTKKALSVYKALQRREPDDQGWWTLYSTALKASGKWNEYTTLCNYELIMTRQIESDKPADFLNRLTHVLEDMHSTARHPIGQSLRNGTQTFNDIFDDSNAIIQELKHWIHEQAIRMTGEHTVNRYHPFLRYVGDKIDFNASWSVNLTQGGFHTSHFHPKGWLSGVFYVDVPEAIEHGGEGWLQFGRPEISQLPLDPDFVVKPETGLLVLFPSFMWHGTLPFSRGKRRMTVAFDLVPHS